jgi:hypothetical protein
MEGGTTQYLAVGVVALGIVGAVMLQKTSGMVAFIPVLAGLAGALSGFGPILFILAVTVCLNAPAFAVSSRSPILDLVLGAAVVAYVIVQYRLQAILTNVFPSDPRQEAAAKPRRGLFRILHAKARGERQRRSADLVTTSEVVGVIWTILTCTILAQYVWIALPTESPNLNLAPPIWRAIVVTWIVGLIWFTTFGLLGYLRDRQMTRDEAMICLQDSLWAETRREQRRLNRWLVWQGRRDQRKERS